MNITAGINQRSVKYEEECCRNEGANAVDWGRRRGEKETSVDKKGEGGEYVKLQHTFVFERFCISESKLIMQYMKCFFIYFVEEGGGRG